MLEVGLHPPHQLFVVIQMSRGNGAVNRLAESNNH